jgi:hypothetical protein
VTDYIKNGWDLYGYPCMSAGDDAYPYQTIVKYSDEEIEGSIVEMIMLEDSTTKDVYGDKIYPDVCKKANEYIKNGYQPYGPVLLKYKENLGTFVEQYLAMVKYK